ncbi:MAG: long-chain-fatty-acid--CoA ligase [Rhodospirillaceae bacterium]
MSLAGLMMDYPLTVTSLMRFGAAYHSDGRVITRSIEGPVHRATYADTYRRIQRLAHALVALGIKPGDRVGTLAWNTWRHLELYYAISGIGAICHTINPRLSPDQMAYVLGHAQDRLLFLDTTFLGFVPALKKAKCSIEQYVALANAETKLPDGNSDVLIYEDLLNPHPEEFDWPEIGENTAASLCYTSATTGKPKGVLYSHRSLVLHSYCLAATFRLDPGQIALPVVPMFHVNAWGLPYAAPMVGASLVFPGKALDGASLFELMDDEGVTCAQGVPTVWMGLIAHMQKVGRKPKNLQSVVIGGAAAPESMIVAFEEEFGVEVNMGWGMTETAPLGVFNTLKPKHKSWSREKRLKQKLKAGRAVYGVDLRIVNSEGRELPHDGESSGHLQVRGPWVLKSYFGNEDDSLTADGWFDTGDIGNLDEDGYLQITDRAKDVIKSGGEWISSVDLENFAMSHPAVAHAAVIGIAHPKWQERPLLVCVVAEGQKAPTLEELRTFLSAKVPSWWLPDAVEFVDSLPLGATGKVQKSVLRERFKDYRLDTSAV